MSNIRKPLTLAQAKVTLKRHVSTLKGIVRGSRSLEEALFVITRSFESKAQGGKAARAKGKRGERLIANIFQQLYRTARRGLQSRGGSDVPDVEGLPLWVEVKCRKVVPGPLTLFRRTQDESDGRPAALVAVEDGKEPTATISLDLLLGLLDEVEVDLTELEARGRGMRENAANLRNGLLPHPSGISTCWQLWRNDVQLGQVLKVRGGYLAHSGGEQLGDKYHTRTAAVEAIREATR